MTHTATTHDTELWTRELDELDRLLHRIRKRMSAPGKMMRPTSYEALRKLRGILQGKLTEDPLSYQQRIRAESDARIIPPAT